MPLSFVACGKSKSDNNTNPSNTEEQPTNPSNPTNPTTPTEPEPVEPENPNPSETIVLTSAEVEEIIENTVEILDDYVSKINNSSSYLKQNNYLELMGINTATTLNYAYYPVLFYNISGKSDIGIKSFSTNKLYVYSTNVSRKYFYVDVCNKSETVNEISLYIMSAQITDSFSYTKFIYTVDDDKLVSLKISHLESTGNDSGFIFSDATLDFANFNLKMFSGNVNGYSSGLSSDKIYGFEDNQVFLESQSSNSKFINALRVYGSYYFYQDISFSENRQFNCLWNGNSDESKKSELEEMFENSFNDFGFLTAYSDFIRCDKSVKENDATIYDDYFEEMERYSRYYYSNYKFVSVN